MPQSVQRAIPCSASGNTPVDRSPFTFTFVLALALGLALAVAISPLAAMGVAAAGFHYPFPRIFDRTVMLTLAAALLLFAQRLELVELLRLGFMNLRLNFAQAVGGFITSMVAIGLLFALAAISRSNLRSPHVMVISALHYLPAAIFIALLEEGFFRAFLLAGIERDYGSSVALVASSAFFAFVHIVRSPAHFYLVGFHPAAGAENLVRSGARLGHPALAMPFLLGLFLLGLALGEAFLLTRRTYYSIGLHTGFVLGAKTWRRAIIGAAPRWLAGRGPVPLIAAPAAWLIAALLLLALPFWFGHLRGEPKIQQS